MAHEDGSARLSTDCPIADDAALYLLRRPGLAASGLQMFLQPGSLRVSLFLYFTGHISAIFTRPDLETKSI